MSLSKDIVTPAIAVNHLSKRVSDATGELTILHEIDFTQNIALVFGNEHIGSACAHQICAVKSNGAVKIPRYENISEIIQA